MVSNKLNILNIPYMKDSSEFDGISLCMKTEEAVKYLSCDRATLFNHRKECILPWYKLGGAIYYNKLEIDQVIASNRVDASNGKGPEN